MKINRYIQLAIILSLFLFGNCTSENPDPTGSFQLEFTGAISESFTGKAKFNLAPTGDNGVLTILLVKNESEYIRISYLNPDPTQVFLEPGTYNVVPQLGVNITKEVLVNYINSTSSFTATSGQVTVGISKNSQINGQFKNVYFELAQITANGTYDAIPE